MSMSWYGGDLSEPVRSTRQEQLLPKDFACGLQILSLRGECHVNFFLNFGSLFVF